MFRKNSAAPLKSEPKPKRQPAPILLHRNTSLVPQFTIRSDSQMFLSASSCALWDISCWSQAKGAISSWPHRGGSEKGV